MENEKSKKDIEKISMLLLQIKEKDNKLKIPNHKNLKVLESKPLEFKGICV